MQVVPGMLRQPPLTCSFRTLQVRSQTAGCGAALTAGRCSAPVSRGTCAGVVLPDMGGILGRGLGSSTAAPMTSGAGRHTVCLMMYLTFEE